MSHRGAGAFTTCTTCGANVKMAKLLVHEAKAHGRGAPAPSRAVAAPGRPREDSPGLERVARELVADVANTTSALRRRGFPADWPEDAPEEVARVGTAKVFEWLLRFRHHALRSRLGLAELEVLHFRRRIVARRLPRDPEPLVAYWLREAEFADAYHALGGGVTWLRLPALEELQGRPSGEVADGLGVEPRCLEGLAEERPDLLRVEHGCVAFAEERYEAFRAACADITGLWEEAQELFDQWGRGYDLVEDEPWADATRSCATRRPSQRPPRRAARRCAARPSSWARPSASRASWRASCGTSGASCARRA